MFVNLCALLVISHSVVQPCRCDLPYIQDFVSLVEKLGKYLSVAGQYDSRPEKFLNNIFYNFTMKMTLVAGKPLNS